MKETMGAIGNALEAGKRIGLGFIMFAVTTSMLTTIMGDTNSAALAAIVVVIGGEIILRRRKKKKTQFGDVARGSEVADHTKEGQ